jgi:uncharacterized protein (TIGR03435 family)
MSRTLACIGFVVLLSGAALSQSTETLPTFDVADVHVSPHSINPNQSGGFVRAGRYEVRKATMVDLIRLAYGLDPDKILGGPSWLETDRFDIVAKAPAGTTQDKAKLMLQSLLADRFKLVVHKDEKSIPGFVLSLGKGKPKLKEADGDGPTACQGEPQTPEPGVIPYNVVNCRNMTMKDFAIQIRNMANAYVTTTVLDSTELKGKWDFSLKWTSKGALALAGADGITVFDAIDKQLGLKLEAQKILTPVIVVESASQKPTDNPPAVVTKLPPPPPAVFEVADIKPSAPGAPQGGGGFMPGGRLDLRAIPMRPLVYFAFDITGDEMVSGAPKWFDDAKFDIVAKASTETGPSGDPQIDDDDLRIMLRSLLEERFKMKTHFEDRPVTAYNLVAVKPKLQKADPVNRTGCKEGPGATGKDPRDATPILSRLITCQNMSMAQLADRLQSLASGYIHTPVLDMTGLDGSYDFTISFSGIGLLRNGGRGGDGGAPGGSGAGISASDPSGAVSLFDAMTKQLGLKLEEKKRVVPVLIFDHMEEKPVDN